MKRRTLLTAAVLALVMCVGLRVRADVLEQIPEDALIVLKVNSLQGVSSKLSKFAEDIGLAQAAPQFSNPLGALQEKAGIKEGLNSEGDMAFVMLDPKSDPDKDKAVLFLLPVSDYKAFLGNFQGAKTEGEISEVTLPETPEPSYVSHWGNYAVLTPSKSVASLKHAGIKAEGAVAKELAAKDIVIFANMPKVKARALPMLQENRADMLAKLEAGLQQSGAGANGQMLKSMFGMAIDGLTAALRDSRGASLSMNFTADGISTTMLGDFNEGTKAAELTSAIKNSSEPLLEGLPTEKYLFIGGFINDPAQGAKISSTLLDPMAAEMKKAAGGEAQAVNDYMDSTKKILSVYTGGAMGVIAPTGAIGQDALIQTISIIHGDSKQLLPAYKKAFSAQQAMMAGMGQKSIKTNVQVKDAAQTIGGVAFDQVNMTFEADPNDPQAQQAQQGINLMYGPNGMQMLLGAVDDQTVLVAMGAPEAQVAAAIESAKKKDTTIAKSESLQSVAANLPKNRAMVGYIAVDQIVSTGLNYARQFGFGVPLQLPPDLPPIGFAVATEGSSFRVDTYTPMPLVQSLVAAGMQLKMQMQGGGQPPAAVP